MEIMVGLDQTNHHTLTQKRKGGVRKRRKWAFLQASIEAAATNNFQKILTLILLTFFTNDNLAH